MTLDRLKPKQQAVIRAVECSQPARGKLMDLGVIPGATLTYVRKAPFGKAVQIEIKRTQLMLRSELAQAIEVQKAS